MMRIKICIKIFFLKTERFFLFRMPSFCLCRCCSSFLSLWLHATVFPPEKLQLFAIFYVLHTSIKNPHLLLICHSTEFLFTLSLSLPSSPPTTAPPTWCRPEVTATLCQGHPGPRSGVLMPGWLSDTDSPRPCWGPSDF